ncbi:GspH/FimT family pseudopilin [Thalassotalea ganghwensis]
MNINVKGFTLIETLVSVAILLVLLLIGVPSMNDFIVKLRVDREIGEISRLLLLARNTALNNNHTVTLCPLLNGRCDNDWSRELSVFTDPNNNKRLDITEGEQIIKTKAAINTGDKLQYGRTRIGVSYAPNGHLAGWGQNATFKYCPKNHANKSRAIVVAITGRIYKSIVNPQTNRDVTRTGHDIVCY